MNRIKEFLKIFFSSVKQQKSKNNTDMDLNFLATLALYALVIDNVIDVNRSEGESMLPTIQDYSILVVDKFFYKFSGIKKNDIVVARSIVDPEILICKRICGLEGEEIYPYVKIPNGHFWAEGDNKAFSFDSRHHGPIPSAAIQGRVLFSLYPWKFFN